MLARQAECVILDSVGLRKIVRFGSKYKDEGKANLNTVYPNDLMPTRVTEYVPSEPHQCRWVDGLGHGVGQQIASIIMRPTIGIGRGCRPVGF